MKTFIFLSLLLMNAFAFAEAPLPAGCKAIAVQGDSVTLEAKKNKLFFIHNVINNDVWITHPVSNAGASAGWSSRLQADNWSALVIDKGPFPLTCIESRPGHEQQIPCEGTIVVCQWKKVKMPPSNAGDFWAAEDMTLSALTTAIGGRGFVLPEPK